MDKSKVKLLLFWIFCALFVASALIFGFIRGSLFLLQTNGFVYSNLYFLLILPFILLFMSFWKIMLGFNVVNTFVPILIVLASFVTGLTFTVSILIFSLLIGYLAKFAIGELHLHFAVRLSMILSFLSIGLLLILPFIEPLATPQAGSNHFIIAYSILVISLINDRFFASKVTKTNLSTTTNNALQTFIFSFITYVLLGGIVNIGTMILSFPYLKDAVVTLPDLVFLAIMLQILIGGYTGLRLTELYRFRKLIFKNN